MKLIGGNDMHQFEGLRFKVFPVAEDFSALKTLNLKH